MGQWDLEVTAGGVENAEELGSLQVSFAHIVEGLETPEEMVDAFREHFTDAKMLNIISTGLNYLVTPGMRTRLKQFDPKGQVTLEAHKQAIVDYYTTWMPGDVVRKSKVSALEKSQKAQEKLTVSEKLANLVWQLEDIGDAENAETYRAQYEEKFGAFPDRPSEG